MLDTLKTYLLFGTNYCGIEHTSNNSVEAILLQKKKNTLEISDSFRETKIKAIAEKLPKKQHAYLIINNEEVLSKCIESNTKEINQLLYTAFPGVSLSDFYYEIHSNQNRHSISICRKETVDTLIKKYKKHAINIVDFSLGNNNTAIINSFIETSSYYTSNALITKQNDVINGIEFTENIPKKSYQINGLNISNIQLLSFAGALSYILQQQKTKSNYKEKTIGLLQNFKQQRFFNQFLVFGLGFILMILLVNFFVFNSYYNEVEIMKETSKVNIRQKEKLLSLKTITDEKQKTVDDILKNATSRSSYYIDKISLSLPNTIQLSELTYQPITKRIKKDAVVQLEENLLIITGISTDSDLFYNWIQTLENFDWIKNVTVTDYGAKVKNTTDFGLKINLAYE